MEKEPATSDCSRDAHLLLFYSSSEVPNVCVKMPVAPAT